MHTAVETWSLSKPAIVAQHGLVASHHYIASDVGAQVLREGGNAVDAAIAASVAIGTQEPWMSGLGGGGFMLVYLAAEDKTYAVDFGMRSPQALDPAAYPLAPGSGADLFNWPAVVENRNLKGYLSMAVPSYAAGLDLALRSYGTRSWQESLAPAIELAERGMAVDWYATLKIATAAADLAEFAESRRVYLPGGFAPAGEWGGPLPTVKLGKLAQTLKRLAEAGVDDFYHGEIAKALVADVQAGGSTISLADLASYQPSTTEVNKATYRDASIYAAPGLSAGPTLLQALNLLSERLNPGEIVDADTYHAYASSLMDAYAERLQTLGDSSAAPSCTTHLSVADKDGNLVALTQTLLSVFGSKVVLPQTGILMNNGIMWFDPRPGAPNSIAPGKRPLANMCPTIVKRSDGLCFATGASGGRRIMPAVFQLCSFLVDYQMSVNDAMHQPRIDVSGTDLVGLNRELPAAVINSLGNNFNTTTVQHGVYPALFACPNVAAFHAANGQQSGAAYIPSPCAKVSPA